MLFPGDGGVVPFEGINGDQRGHRGQIPVYIGDSHVQMSPDHRPGMLVEKNRWESTEVFFADEWKIYQHSQRFTHTEMPNSFWIYLCLDYICSS